MRKFSLVLALLFSVLMSSPSFAAVGIKKDGVLHHTATDINFKNVGQTVSTDGSTTSFNLMMLGAGPGGATSMIDTDTAVPTGYSVVYKKLSASTGVAMTLADGTYQGQVLTIRITERTSSGTAVLRPTTPDATYTAINFDGVGDSVILMWDSAWRIMDGNSVTWQ